MTCNKYEQYFKDAYCQAFLTSKSPLVEGGGVVEITNWVEDTFLYKLNSKAYMSTRTNTIWL